MTHQTDDTMSRRELLRNAAIGAAGLILLPATSLAGRAPNPYKPFRMAIQSYTLRGYKLDEALAKTKAIGLNFWEGWDGHIADYGRPQADPRLQRETCRK